MRNCIQYPKLQNNVTCAPDSHSMRIFFNSMGTPALIGPVRNLTNEYLRKTLKNTCDPYISQGLEIFLY